jgi:hypothetical protein
MSGERDGAWALDSDGVTTNLSTVAVSQQQPTNSSDEETS